MKLKNGRDQRKKGKEEQRKKEERGKGKKEKMPLFTMNNDGCKATSNKAGKSRLTSLF